MSKQTSSRIGLRDVKYAVMTSDPKDGVATYGPIKDLVGAAVANVNPNSSASTDFLDDGPADTAVTIGQGEFNLEIGSIPNENKAELLGHTYSGGVLVKKGSATPPFVAIGFKSLKADGTYKYKWLYKVKFREPEDNTETKGESINFQHDVMIGTFVKRESDDNWEASLDTADPNVPAATISTFFDFVYGTSGDTTAPTLTSVPTSGAAGVAVDTAVVITFDEDMDKATLIPSNFAFTEIDGTLVPYTMTITDTTATLTPDSNLAAATQHQVIVTTGVTDVSGNALAQTNVILFTTA